MAECYLWNYNLPCFEVGRRVTEAFERFGGELVHQLQPAQLGSL